MYYTITPSQLASPVVPQACTLRLPFLVASQSSPGSVTSPCAAHPLVYKLVLLFTSSFPSILPTIPSRHPLAELSLLSSPLPPHPGPGKSDISIVCISYLAPHTAIPLGGHPTGGHPTRQSSHSPNNCLLADVQASVLRPRRQSQPGGRQWRRNDERPEFWRHGGVAPGKYGAAWEVIIGYHGKLGCNQASNIHTSEDPPWLLLLLRLLLFMFLQSLWY